VPLYAQEHQRAVDTSSAILIPGYEFNHFSRNRLTEIANEITILYPGTRITMEVFQNFDEIAILLLVCETQPIAGWGRKQKGGAYP
jgi:hypothetical protein